VILTGDAVVVAVDAASLGPRALALHAEVPGIAGVGRVVACGPDATHLDGKRVAVGAFQACGDCDVCRRAGATVCPAGRTLGVDAPGCAAAEVTARARWVLPLEGPLELPGAHAALVGGEAALAFALYARAGVGPREPAAVVGDGPVAHLALAVLRAKSVEPVHVRTADELRDALAGKPAKVLADDTGAAAALAGAGPRATVAIASLVAPALNGAALSAALAREVTVIGVRGAHPDLLPEVAALAIRGELDLAGACVLVRDLAAALALAQNDKAGARAVVITSSSR
jgi:D-arabinose 1-dehydrogenase-like Zn-dependent alcohol dehydrogenase